MKGITSWGYTPYRPYDHAEEATKPFICRMAPYEDRVEIEWFDKGSNCEHELRYRRMESTDEWITMPVNETCLTVSNLEIDTDYEFQLARLCEDKAESAVRYARTGAVPGKIVNYLHPQDTIYAFSGRSLCSPSIAKLPSGAIFASMDVYAANQPQNLTLIFRSDDRGETWHYVTDLFPAFWSTIFYHRGKLYVQSCSTEYGDILIGCSEDEGRTWSKPERLFVGSSSNQSGGWQRTPMPMLHANGRIYVSTDYGRWDKNGHAICVLSASEDADLMKSESWCVSELTRYDDNWPGAPVGHSAGVLEGSMVVSPDGRLLDILRLSMGGCKPNYGMSVVLESDWNDPEAKQKFAGFVNLPSGANSKTHIMQDPVEGKYYAIGNVCESEKTSHQRNILALQVSDDLVHWSIAKILLDYRHEDPNMVGFQYISFIFDGDDILYLSRTAINNARNYHDANYQTFHIIRDFRSLAK